MDGGRQSVQGAAAATSCTSSSDRAPRPNRTLWAGFDSGAIAWPYRKVLVVVIIGIGIVVVIIVIHEIIQSSSQLNRRGREGIPRPATTVTTSRSIGATTTRTRCCRGNARGRSSRRSRVGGNVQIQMRISCQGDACRCVHRRFVSGRASSRRRLGGCGEGDATTDAAVGVRFPNNHGRRQSATTVAIYATCTAVHVRAPSPWSRSHGGTVRCRRPSRGCWGAQRIIVRSGTADRGGSCHGRRLLLLHPAIPLIQIPSSHSLSRLTSHHPVHLERRRELRLFRFVLVRTIRVFAGTLRLLLLVSMMMFVISRLDAFPHEIRRTIARLREGTGSIAAIGGVGVATAAAAAGIRSISWRGRRVLRLLPPRGRQIIFDSATACLLCACSARRPRRCCHRPARRRPRWTSRGVGTPSRLHLRSATLATSFGVPLFVPARQGSRRPLSASFLPIPLVGFEHNSPASFRKIPISTLTRDRRRRGAPSPSAMPPLLFHLTFSASGTSKGRPPHMTCRFDSEYINTPRPVRW